MRGSDQQQSHVFSYISPEERVRKDHPLRPIRTTVDEILKQLSPQFHKMYAKVGRPSISPEQLLRAQLLQMLYSVRSERPLMEEMDYNILFRWFVGLNLDDPVWDATVFTSRVLASPFPVVTTACTGSLYQTTGCPGSSFAGYVVPANFSTLLPMPPASVLRSDHNSPVEDPAPKDNFAPRLGFAWQPLSTSDRWVVRAGAGYFYSRVQQDTTYSNLELEQIPMAYQPTIPAGWEPRRVTAAGASSNKRVQTMSESYPTPLVYQWNLNTQYEFRPTWVIEVGYVGSREIHQALGFKPNGAVLVSASQPSPTNAATTSNLTTNTALRVPYAGFATNWTIDGTPADFKFNGAQVIIRKQPSHGFSFQSAYTWTAADQRGLISFRILPRISAYA
jgi:Transposase domain (DUF772)